MGLWTYGRTTQKNYREIADAVDKPFASTSITTDLSNEIELTGIGNDDFIGDTGFIPLTGYIGGVSNKFTFDSKGFMVVPQDGYYQATGYATFFCNTNANTVAIKFSFNGSSLSPRPVPSRLPNGGDYGEISGNGSFYALKGTVVGVSVASEKDCTLTVPNSTIDITLLKSITL